MNFILNHFIFLHIEDKEKSLSYCMNLLSEKKVTVVDLYEQILRPALNNIIAEYPDPDELIWREHVRSSIVRTIIVGNETIGFIFQFHHMLAEFTVFENVLMPYRIKHNKVTKEALELADELIETVGLTKVKHNKATDLSGGQQQRAAIARSLINRPKIILGDEPTGNLDTETTKIVFNLLKKINEEFKSTFILITHDQKVAQLADRIIDIKDGRINMDLMN